jgi:hypothetical protein
MHSFPNQVHRFREAEPKTLRSILYLVSWLQSLRIIGHTKAYRKDPQGLKPRSLKIATTPALGAATVLISAGLKHLRIP